MRILLMLYIIFYETILCRAPGWSASMNSDSFLPGNSSELIKTGQSPACEVAYYRTHVFYKRRRRSVLSPKELPSVAKALKTRQRNNNFITDSSKWSRIKEGNDTSTLDHPYAVIYGRLCSGTLLNMEWVLTAAHCGDEHDFVAVGANVHCSCSEYPICAHFIHPKYRQADMLHRFDYDYQLLLLTKKLPSDPHIQPIPVGNRKDIKPGTVVTIAGYGYNDKMDIRMSDTLKEIRLPVLSREDCLSLPDIIFTTATHRMLCAGTMNMSTGIGVCRGDSGGPVVSNGKLVGIVSFTKHCEGPVGILKVTKNFIQRWLQTTIKEDLPGLNQGRSGSIGGISLQLSEEK